MLFRSESVRTPAFIRMHLDHHLRCLELSFDVKVVTGSCSYDRICDTLEPDLALFESGVYATDDRSITGTDRQPGVPKLGLINADAYCISRAKFVSEMERWGVETYFTISVSMAEYSPELAERLFVWPNFIEPELYRDYGEEKMVPVLFTGSQASHYPWRNQIASAVTPSFPSMSCPHFGWFDSIGDARTIFGERYARLINSSYVTPTCGTIARDVVRKHFEIPACRSCLVTERTASVEAAGFVDMVNCVFADRSDVVDRLDYLFRNPDRLEEITDAGHALAHSRHTAAQRDQIHQWYRLNLVAGPGQTIRQPGPFEPLELAGPGPAQASGHVISGSVDRTIMVAGDQALRRGRIPAAREAYLRCEAYHLLPDAVLRLAICALLEGNPHEARAKLRHALEFLMKEYRSEPDPVDWAYYIRSLVCSGDLEAASRRSSQFPHIHHRELDRMRAALTRLLGLDAQEAAFPVRSRPSIHDLPDDGPEAWLAGLQTMLNACGRGAFAELLDGWQVQSLPPVRPATPVGRNESAAPCAVPASGVGLLPLEEGITLWAGRVRRRLARLLPQVTQSPDLSALESLVERLPVTEVTLAGESRLRWRRRLEEKGYELLGAAPGIPSRSVVDAVRTGVARNPNRPRTTSLFLRETGQENPLAPSGSRLVLWMTGRVPTTAEMLALRSSDFVVVSSPRGATDAATADTLRAAGEFKLTLQAPGQTAPKGSPPTPRFAVLVRLQNGWTG